LENSIFRNCNFKDLILDFISGIVFQNYNRKFILRRLKKIGQIYYERD